jgi:CBS domain containing-hemolysin-like protein
MGLRLVLLFAILVANAFFAAAEVALVSVRRSRLRARADQGEVGAQVALNLLGNPERLLSVSQVGMTLASLGLGWAGEETIFEILKHALGGAITPANEKILHAICFVLAFLFISFLHIIVGEVIPKNLALEKSDRLAILLAPPLAVFARLSSPFVYIVERCAGFITKRLGLHKGGHGSGGHSAEELKFIVRTSRLEGHLEGVQEAAIERVLDLSDLSAREIMVPRPDMITVSVDSSLDDILAVMAQHKYSRMPVYDGAPEKIIGVLHYKDLIRVWQERKLSKQRGKNERPFRIRRYIRKAIFVPESKPLIQLLEQFRENHTHLALVVDEFGTVAGLVTLEDLLEQVFGEIGDEHDSKAPPAAPESPSLSVDGTIPIRDLLTIHQIELPADAGFETLAGFLLFKLGRVPKPGDEIEHGGRRFTIVDMERHRIQRVRIERREPAVASA